VPAGLPVSRSGEWQRPPRRKEPEVREPVRVQRVKLPEKPRPISGGTGSSEITPIPHVGPGKVVRSAVMHEHRTLRTDEFLRFRSGRKNRTGAEPPAQITMANAAKKALFR